MTSWTVLLGALGAAGIAWAAIASIALVDRGKLHASRVRTFGALALGVVALRVAGVPIPWLIAPALLGVGLAWGLIEPRLEDTAA